MSEVLQAIVARVPESADLIASPATVSPWAWMPLLLCGALALVLRKARRTLAQPRAAAERRRAESELRPAA